MKKQISHSEFLDTALNKTLEWTKVNTTLDSESQLEAYVVWSCKTLQNSKALLATTNSDGMYFEATLNGDKNEMYFDAYKKVENIKIEM